MEIQPLHTSVDKTIVTSFGIIVLEIHKGFPSRESNLYCLTPGQKIIWKAEKPEDSTLYSRVRLNEDGQTLSAYTTGGHACELELKTGKLISHTSIK
ncbi:MAG: hypothetical protein WCC12_00875 [Anaerolineales bacterium]